MSPGVSADSGLANRAGFWRRLRVTPAAGAVCSQLEDDFHCMTVTVHHDGDIADHVDAVMHRAPWTTCPGAEAKLQQTFRGLPLSRFASQVGEKRQNCTHLHDLAVLAAEHAGDSEPLVYDIVVGDPEGGLRTAELQRNGESVLRWQDRDFVMVSPEGIANQRLDKLRSWIEAQDAPIREAARLLQWGMMLAHGRLIPLADQSDAQKMPANCYTFQPERAERARRVGEIKDFSYERDLPLRSIAPTLSPRVNRA